LRGFELRFSLSVPGPQALGEDGPMSDQVGRQPQYDTFADEFLEVARDGCERLAAWLVAGVRGFAAR
jgi:hypothetical protein